MDLIGVSGLIVSVAGFAMALWQLHRTRKAAEAAQLASSEAVRSVRLVQSIATIQDICGRSRELLHLTRSRNLESSAIAAFELRDSVALFKSTETARKLDDKKGWDAIIDSICIVHERLESASVTKRLDASEREEILHDVARINSHFSSMASITVENGT